MLTLEELTLTYHTDEGTVEAVKGISFNLEQGEFYTLLGPSGCGKSSTLRSVAGLETPDRGKIEIAGQVAFSSEDRISISPNKRDYGMVFQSYAIWPHMTVYDNVAFPLAHGRRKLTKAEVREKANKALDLVQLDHLAKRPAPYLSGGQQQRVALARALALEPAVLLLDEPLSNLDAKLRDEMRAEIKDLAQRVGITTLYVTHDQIEALALSDRLAVMLDGEIIQEGTPWEVYSHPHTTFVAEFLGKANFLEGDLQDDSIEGTIGVVETAHGTIKCTVPSWTTGRGRVVVACRPEAVRLHKSAPADTDNVLPCRVTDRTFLGDSVEYVVRVGDQLLMVKSAGALLFDVGQEAFAELDVNSCQVINS